MLGVAFSYEPVIPGRPWAAFRPNSSTRSAREADDKAREAVRRASTQRRKRAGVSAETPHPGREHCRRRRPASAHLARRFDLAVVGQAEPDTGGARRGDRRGRAVRIRPPGPGRALHPERRLKLDRVMVCWDGSRAAARAIADAMPFLNRAKAVEVVIVAEQGGQERRNARRRSRPAPRAPRPQGRRQAHHLAAISTSPPRFCPTRPTLPPT